MYYYGYFRNIDDSIDKDGQLFKVAIFTDIGDWEHSLVYPFEDVSSTSTPILIPVDGIELTMTAQPFTVEYANDNESIFKPYKCSTASISFLQSELNKEFLNINGRNVMVALLKWNNDVIFNETLNRYENNATGATLNETVITDGSTEVYRGFPDYTVDKFCYTVEWIGFSTPETYSMGYNNINDIFTLNAQDALSILQYTKFSKGNMEYLKTITEVFSKIIADLGTYQHIYISDSLVVPSTDRDAITTKVFTQIPNYFDEDGEPVDRLTVIEELCKTLNITIVPFQDSIYIVDYNALVNGNDTYYHYKLSNGFYFFNNIQGRNYSYVGTKRLEHLHNINANSFSLTGTNITTSNTYNSVKLTDDDYLVGNIAPDVKDNDTLDTDNDVNLGQQYTTLTWQEEEGGETVDKYEYWLFEGFSYDFASRTASEVFDKGEMIAYNYNADYFNDNIYKFSTTPLTGSNKLNYSDFSTYIGACALDYQTTETENILTIPMNYNLDRVIYFHTPTNPNYRLDGRYVSTSYSPDQDYYSLTHSYHQQKLLTMRTRTTLFDANKVIQIKGTWNFYNTFNLIYDSHKVDIYPSWMYTPDTLNRTNSNFIFIGAKVKLVVGTDVYWLKFNSNQTYTWETTEDFCKLMLEYDITAFGTGFNFRVNKRGMEGICLPDIPLSDNTSNLGYLQIDIYRPLGTCARIASSSILKDLDISLLGKDYVESMGQSNGDENNTEYSQSIFSTAVCDFEGITLKATTTNDKNLNYSHLVYKSKSTDSDYKILEGDITNAYTGLYGKPEELIINNIVQQYKNPMIKLDLNLHYNIGFTPYSLITWNSQFEGKKFIIDSMGIDYEMNRNTLKIVEKNPDLDFNDIYRMNVQRKFRRNGELNTIDRVKGAKQLITRTTELPTQGKVYGIEYSSGNVKLTTALDTPEKFINFKVKFMDGDLLVAIPPEIDDDVEVEVNYDYGDLTITEN